MVKKLRDDIGVYEYPKAVMTKSQIAKGYGTITVDLTGKERNENLIKSIISHKIFNGFIDKNDLTYSVETKRSSWQGCEVEYIKVSF